MRHIVLDTETTGLSAKDGHLIIEIGAVEMVNLSLTGQSLHLYINPEREIDAGAQEIHGLSLNFWQTSRSLQIYCLTLPILLVMIILVTSITRRLMLAF